MMTAIRHRAVAALIAAMVVFPFFRGNARAQDGTGEKGLKVTILLYSGRPDPSFRIDDEAVIGTMRSLIGKSKSIEFRKETVIPSALGYKGVVVENVSRVSGVPGFVAVYKGNIEVRDGGTTFRRDENDELEGFLLKQGVARKAVTPDVLKAAGVAIGTWPTPEKGE